MRIGVMVGPERGRYATKVERLRADVRWAEESGLATVWIPQIPDDFDALTAVAVVGLDTTRIEIGTAVVPVQTRHPIALAHQALSVQAVCEGRLTLGLGVSHHWIIDEMLGLPYERPVPTMRAYLDVLDQALRGPGPVDVENEFFRIHNPLAVTDVAPTPVLLAALGPRMLQLAGERTDGTILWMADERAIGAHIAPTITQAATAAGRAAPRIVAGIPVCLCADDEIDVAVARYEPHPLRSRSVAELSAPARSGRRAQCRRHPRRGNRSDDREAVARVRRRGRHRRVVSRRPDRRRTRRAHRILAADPGVRGRVGASRLPVAR